MPIYDFPADPPVQIVMIAQAAATKSTLPKKLREVSLDMPWVVPNDPQYLYQKGRFAAGLGASACADLLQSFKFKSLGWKSLTCKVIKIVNFPTHGTLIDEGKGAYGFRPTDAYLGRDSVRYIVEGTDGRRVLVTMTIALQTMAKAFANSELTRDQRNSSIAAWQKQFQHSALYSMAPSASRSEFGALSEVRKPASLI